jgi:hypothetical protein
VNDLSRQFKSEITIGVHAINPLTQNQLAAHAPGLRPRAVQDQLARVQMLDVWLPITDDRFLAMPRHTEPDPEQARLLHQFNLQLPPQPASMHSRQG